MIKIDKRKLRQIGHLVSRNVFLLVNAIIFAVVVLLIFFGEIKEGVFLGIIIVVNTLLALIQDIYAWLSLEKLELLTAVRVVRINANGTTSSVLTAELGKNDRVALKLGDQVPCDGVLISANGLEVNEALITGESNSFLRAEGASVLAGSIVTSGAGVLRVAAAFRESRIARMTESIKKYSMDASPIQQAVNTVIKYSGYVLLLVVAFVIARGVWGGLPGAVIVRSIGALASLLVPQGLVLATTLLFAYGGLYLFRRHVLLQEVNATEKLGRIKNLCLDKTGTLTDRALQVEEILIPDGVSKDEAEDLAAAYVRGLDDSSETISALKSFLNRSYTGKIIDVLPFSSSRQYGGVRVKSSGREETILAGAPDVFAPRLSRKAEKDWQQRLLQTHALAGKHIICVARASGLALPRNLKSVELSAVAVVVLHNALRAGIREAIAFFQDRGVSIRILSGDNADTVRAVATLSGIHNVDSIVTGVQMEAWSDADFRDKSRLYTIFARVKPEQKEKIIEGLKKDGFTAMVGDGANDALAVKKADLGIAMFDGAPATRQLAAVVLTQNNFAELPGGVKLADRIVQNTEILSSIFFNQIFMGFFLFVTLSVFGYSFPLTPLNITFINYFSVVFPGSLIFYWAIRSKEDAAPASMQSFLRKVVPFSLASAVIQSLGIMIVFGLNLTRMGTIELSTIVALTIIVFAVIFFLLAPGIYGGATSRAQKVQFFWLGLLELLLLFLMFKISWVTNFFDIISPSIKSVAEIFFVTGIFASILYVLARSFFAKSNA